MKITIKLNKSNGDRQGNGYEIVVYCSHLRKRKQKIIGYSKVEHFNSEMQLVNEKHPEYDELIPRLMDLKIKARKVIASGCENVDQAMELLFEKDQDLSFINYCESHIAEMLEIANAAEKRGDLINRNRTAGTARAKRNSLNQFRKFYPELLFSELDYSKIMSFRTHYENLGASKKTIEHYISALKSMYNRGVLEKSLPDQRPFARTLDNLKVKSFNAKKKYIEIDDIKKLENYSTVFKGKQRAADLFLLQFYLGGCDLTDLYFLKSNSVFRNRILIERSKTRQVADLKIHENAKRIIEKHKAKSGEWLFDWDKSVQSYRYFLANYFKTLGVVQKELDIEIMPTGGNLSVKVARHTFANRGKQLMIDADIIRELMGHERDDIDNYYKDKFSKEVRDQAHFKIIDTSKC